MSECVRTSETFFAPVQNFALRSNSVHISSHRVKKGLNAPDIDSF